MENHASKWVHHNWKLDKTRSNKIVDAKNGLRVHQNGHQTASQDTLNMLMASNRYLLVLS